MCVIWGVLLVSRIFAFENSLFFEWTPEYLFTDKHVSISSSEDAYYFSMYTSANIGWFGRFNNNFGVITDLSAGLLQMLDNKAGLPESITDVKFGIGAGYIGDQFMFYGSPNLSIINNSIGMNGTVGIKIYFPVDEWGVCASLGVDTPTYQFGNNLSFNPQIDCRIGLGIIYNLSYKKQMEIKNEKKRQENMEQSRLAAERKQQEIEKQKLEHEKMLLEKGLTEEDWQNQEKEKNRQAAIKSELESKEKNALSKLIQNIIDVGYPIDRQQFSVGEVVAIPFGLFTAIDYSYVDGMNSYLVMMNDYNTPLKPFYIESKRQLDSIGPLRIQYIGQAQYLANRDA